MAFERELKFLMCVGGIYGCYLTYGIAQEQLMKVPHEDGSKFNFTFFMLFVQCTFSFLLAGGAWLVSGQVAVEDKKATTLVSLLGTKCQMRFAMTATTYVLAMLCSNEALKYVSYPMQALAKSCKLIPVMLMRVVIRRAKYPLSKYIIVLVMTAGVATFQLSKVKSGGDKETSIVGVLLLVGSLTFDGLTGPSQEKLNQDFKPSNVQFMALTNLWALSLMLALSYYMGELHTAVAYLTEHPRAQTDLLLLAACSACGQMFIYYTIRTFDSLILTTVTTTRKFLTILVSVVRFGHTLMPTQWLAVGMVFAAILADLVLKYWDSLCGGCKRDNEIQTAAHRAVQADPRRSGNASQATGTNGTLRKRNVSNKQ